MPWVTVDGPVKIELKPRDCGDCGVKPGEPHHPGCDMERCSACGRQRITCSAAIPPCRGRHDPLFSRWTGFGAGELEAIAMGYLCRWERDPNNPVPGDWAFDDGVSADLNRFFADRALVRTFLVKPKKGLGK
jgi:hypothetical protein